MRTQAGVVKKFWVGTVTCGSRHEAERTEVLRGLQEERQAAELTRSKQQEVGILDHMVLEPKS